MDFVVNEGNWTPAGRRERCVGNLRRLARHELERQKNSGAPVARVLDGIDQPGCGYLTHLEGGDSESSWLGAEHGDEPGIAAREDSDVGRGLEIAGLNVIVEVIE